MMAFFLLMWLLGSTAQGDLQGIAEFFQNPLKVALPGGSGSGDSSSILKGGGQDLTRSAGQVKRGQVAEPRMSVNLGAQRGENSDPTPEAVERQRQERTAAGTEVRRSRPPWSQPGPARLSQPTAAGRESDGCASDHRRAGPSLFDSASAELKPYTAPSCARSPCPERQETGSPGRAHRCHALRRRGQRLRQLGDVRQSRQRIEARVNDRALTKPR